jgi:hypothetical protein
VLFCDKSAALESPLELTCSAHWHRVFCPIRSGELGRGRKHPIHMSEDLKQFDSARGSRAQKNPRRRASATYLIQQSPAKKQLSPDLTALLSPARELLISLGWLRLFQSIVSHRYPAVARRELRPEG